MADDGRWVTIVVRAWPDVDGVRARLLLADSEGGGDHRVVASIDDAIATVDAWLHVLDDDGINFASDAADHRTATTERRTVRRDADADADERAEGTRRRS
jgi:hypothetical protein